MGFLRISLIFAILVALTAVVVQRFSPDTVDTFLSHPSIQAATLKANNWINDATVKINKSTYPLYVKTSETLKPAIAFIYSKLDDTFGVFADTKDDGAVKSPDQDKDQKKKKKKKKKTKEILLTASELKEYDGTLEGKGLYLALLGQVFDVKKGRQHYGPGGGYEFFAARDASRAYVSGNFEEEGLTDDIEGLSYQDYIGLSDWLSFYNKDYTYVGKLIGRYYNADGSITEYKRKADQWLAEAQIEKEKEAHGKKLFPPCNSEWSQDSGLRVWCTKMSGGVERSWVGVPRKLYSPGTQTPRCACVKDAGSPTNPALQGIAGTMQNGDLGHPNLKEYPGCHPEESYCELGQKDYNDEK